MENFRSSPIGPFLLLSIAFWTGCGGSSHQQQTILTTASDLPSIQLSATPNPVDQGSFTTVTWITNNATSISFSPSIGGEDQNLPLRGSAPVSFQKNGTITATVVGPGGTATQALAIVVNERTPTLVLGVSPPLVAPGGIATLSWTSTNASSVTISELNTSTEPSGEITISPTSTTAYTATAIGKGGSASQTVVVPVTNYTPPPGLEKIKHIIFLVQENRSFDHYFGRLGVYKANKGFSNDIDGFCENCNGDPTLAPLYEGRLGIPVSLYHQRTQVTDGIDPSWNPSHADLNGSLPCSPLPNSNCKMDRFAFATHGTYWDPNGDYAMGYYDESDLPYYYELATQFATSDRWFSPVLASTVPNRLYLFSGTSLGYAYAPSFAVGRFQQPTIFDALDKAGVAWKYYYQDSSIFLPQFAIWNNLADRGRVRRISEWFTILTSPSADNLLPPVVFIERATATGYDEHPTNEIQIGAARSKQIIDALLKSPAWQSSVFILTYDEGGSLADHVPPFQEVKPDSIAPILGSKDIPGAFDESGFRVPLIVISPWVKPHFVSHTNSDYTAILKLIETRFGLPALTARDAAQPDMTEFFDFSAPHWLTPPPLPSQPINGVALGSLETHP